MGYSRPGGTSRLELVVHQLVIKPRCRGASVTRIAAYLDFLDLQEFFETVHGMV